MAEFFANPAALWAGLLVIPLLVLFMLRHRPVKLRVPSTLLWQGVAQAQVATSRFQMLRRSLSLLLMLLALLALVLALSGFRIPDGERVQPPIVMIIDLTASMGALEGNRTRLESARERAGDLLDGAGNAEVTLLTFDGVLRPTGATGSTAAARAALQRLEAVHRGAPTAGLVRVVRTAAESEPDKRFILISDSAPGGMPGNVLFVPVGRSQANAGVVVAGLTDAAGGRADLFAGVEYSGGEPQRVTVLLERLDQGQTELLDARDIDLRPLTRTPVTFPGVREGLYRVRLRLEDALALDNEAYIRFAAIPPLGVVLPADCPDALRKACNAISAGMGTITLESNSGPDSAFVLAGAASAGVSPRLPAAYLGPLVAPDGVRFGPERTLGATDTRPVQAALWRGADNPEVSLQKAYTIETDRLIKPLLEAGEGTAMGTVLRDNGLEDLVLGFVIDESASGFTSRYAWLILWANWFEYVRRLLEPLPSGSLSTQEAIRVAELEGRGPFRLRPADGDWIESAPGRAISLDRVGVYEVAGLVDARVEQVGVSLLDAAESNLAGPGQEYDAEVAGLWLDSFEGGGTRALDLRPWLALLAAALLLFDWYWFRRRFPQRSADLSASRSPRAATASHTRQSVV